MNKSTVHRFYQHYSWLLERTSNQDCLLLKEGLITSYPVDVLMKDLSLRYKNIHYNQKDGTFIVDKIPSKQRESLSKKLDLYGYFISDEQIDDKDTSLIGVLVEPKFPSEIPFSTHHEELKYLYHITTDKYIDKIKKRGLIPKESNRKLYKTNGNRIYFVITDYPDKDLPLLKKMLAVDDNRKHFLQRPNKYYLLRVNFNELNNEIVFYRDPRLSSDKRFNGQGIFTLNNVSPDKIEFLGEI